MHQVKMMRLKDIHAELIKIAQTWAGKKPYDAELARELRKEAILILHDHYCQHIPVYQKLAKELGMVDLNAIEPIKSDLMSTDDIFKSYDQSWLDEKDFNKMNQWLGNIFDKPIHLKSDHVETIDEWINQLAAEGITVVYSSGTTGRFSFVPRCSDSWHLFTAVPTSYVGLLFMNLGLIPNIPKKIISTVSTLLSPEIFGTIVKGIGLPGYNGIFMNFKKGNMGIQVAGQEFSKLFKTSCFLYDIELSASALRLISRGAQNEDDQKLISAFQTETIDKKEKNYLKIIDALKQSTCDGQKVFLFGAPYQLKELIGLMTDKNLKISLKKKSVVMYGGGWKSFEGNKISQKDLDAMISETLDVPKDLIVEGYSMTEISGTMIRCHYGRFHMPPNIEPVILNQELVPLEGNDLKGAFGFLDPFAVSYPGFTITGDNVHLQNDTCPCGMHGPALSEVGRAPGREVKGCGGMMASVQA